MSETELPQSSDTPQPEELRASLVKIIEKAPGSDEGLNNLEVTHEDPDYLQSAHDAVVELAESAGIMPRNILVSGYIENTDEDEGERKNRFQTIDSHGLHFDSNDNHIDDTDSHAVIAKEMNDLRSELQRIARSLIEAEADGNDDALDAGKKEILAIKAEIADLKKALDTPLMPIYYFTTADGLLDTNPEDNPLQYAGLSAGRSVLGIYDRSELEAAGYKITNKSNEQIRVYIPDEEIDKYRRAVMHIRMRDSDKATNESDVD